MLKNFSEWQYTATFRANLRHLIAEGTGRGQVNNQKVMFVYNWPKEKKLEKFFEKQEEKTWEYAMYAP